MRVLAKRCRGQPLQSRTKSLAGRLRGRPGQPRGPLTGGTASTIGSSSMESWVLAADSPTASGMSPRSTSRWYLEPGLPRSIGFGMVSSPPPFGAHAERVQAGSGPVELAVAAELIEQQVVQTPPDPARCQSRSRRQQVAGLPSSPAGAAARGRRCVAGRRCDKHGALVDARSAAVAAWWSGQQWLDGLHNMSGTRASTLVVIATDHAREQGEQQEPAEGWKHALSEVHSFR
jgi:hypothetical protein